MENADFRSFSSLQVGKVAICSLSFQVHCGIFLIAVLLDGPVDVYLVRRIADEKETEDTGDTAKETRDLLSHDSPVPSMNQVS